MKIRVNEEDLFEISDLQRKVICNDIPEEIFDEDMKRRIQYIIDHKYQRCLERLKNEWMPRLKERVSAIPTQDLELAELIFSQPDYKCRSTREKESQPI